MMRTSQTLPRRPAPVASLPPRAVSPSVRLSLPRCVRFSMPIDTRDGTVSLFDTSGAGQGVVGRQGEGPGEFGWPVLVAGTGVSRQLLVGDAKPPSATFFADVQAATAVRFSGIPGMPVHLLGGSADEVLAVWTPFFGDKALPSVGLLRQGEMTAKTLFVLTNAETGVVPVVADTTGALYAGTGPSDYTIEKRAVPDGRLLRTIGPSMTVRLPTDIELARQRSNIEDAARQSGIPFDREALRSALDSFRRKPMPVFTPWGFAVDGRDRLWVATTLPSFQRDSTRIDILSREGEPVQVKVRDRVLALAIEGPLVAMLVERAHTSALGGTKGVDVYRIRDP